jgi:hypothetical protein
MVDSSGAKDQSGRGDDRHDYLDTSGRSRLLPLLPFYKYCLCHAHPWFTRENPRQCSMAGGWLRRSTRAIHFQLWFPSIEVFVSPTTRISAVLVIAAALIWPVASSGRALAAGGGSGDAVTAQQLSFSDVYVAPGMFSHSSVRRGDPARLRAVTTAAAQRGIPTKIGIISHYPAPLHSPTEAAQALRNFMDYSGVVILVTPAGIGISSDELSNADIASIERRVAPECRVEAADCAIHAARLAMPRVLAIQSKANRNAAIFWVVSVGLFALVMLVLVLLTRRRRADAPPEGVAGVPSTPTGT